MMPISLVLPLLLAAVITTGAAEAPSTLPNQKPLAETPFSNLRLGSVKPRGWLLQQMQNQKTGLTGQAESVIPEIGPDSGWRGGNGEGWEKGPYYLKGLVTLAYTLDDPELKRTAQVWIDAILASQQPDGFYGPGKRDEVDWWPRMVVDWALRDYYEATGDPRVLQHLANYYRYMQANLPKRPLFDWGKARAADEMDTVFWLYNQTGDKSLIETAELLRKQAWDWVDIYSNNRFQHFGTFYTYHNVNVPQAFKFPLMSYELSKSDLDRNALAKGWAHLERDHGLSFGMTSGTEFLSGNSPSQGTEMCSFVEQMLSFYTATRVLGDAVWADRAEKIAFNGMPAGLTKDFKQYQYYTLPNEVIAKPGMQAFNQDYADGIIPGPHSGCHCCCYNLHMGWPKFCQHSWMASSDHGLAAILYAPTELTTTLNGAEISIIEDGGYPFSDTIQMTVTVAKSVEFPLHLRIPGWCAQPEVAVNGKAQAPGKSGSFLTLNRTWKSGDVVSLRFPMAVKVSRGVLNTMTVERGPLVYALKIGEKFSPLNQEPHGFPDLQCEPTTPWNYALVVDQSNPAKSFEFSQSQLKGNPFSVENVPVTMTAKARRIPDWTLAPSGLIAYDPPVSPVASTEPEEKVTLVPIGATTLHISSFPWIGEPVASLRSFKADFNDGTLKDWVLYGGNCSVRDGQLSLEPDNNYMKAVVPGLVFHNFTLQADLAIGEKGDGGFMFRAGKMATGADTHQGYYVGINAGRKLLVIGKHDGQHWHSINEIPLEIEPRKTVHLTVVADGDRFRVLVGPKAVYELKNGDFSAGLIGVREFGADFFTVDNFSAVEN